MAEQTTGGLWAPGDRPLPWAQAVRMGTVVPRGMGLALRNGPGKSTYFYARATESIVLGIHDGEIDVQALPETIEVSVIKEKYVESIGFYRFFDSSKRLRVPIDSVISPVHFLYTPGGFNDGFIEDPECIRELMRMLNSKQMSMKQRVLMMFDPQKFKRENDKEKMDVKEENANEKGFRKTLLTVKHVSKKARKQSYDLAPPIPITSPGSLEMEESASMDEYMDEMDIHELKTPYERWMHAVECFENGNKEYLDGFLKNEFSIPPDEIFVKAIVKGNKALMSKLFTHLNINTSLPLELFRKNPTFEQNNNIIINNSDLHKFFQSLFTIKMKMSNVVSQLLKCNSCDIDVFNYFYLLVCNVDKDNNEYLEKLLGLSPNQNTFNRMTGNPYYRRTGEGEFLGDILRHLGSPFCNISLARKILEIARKETSGRCDVSDYHLIALSEPGSLKDAPNGECELSLGVKDGNEENGTKIADSRSIVKKMYSCGGVSPLHFAAINPDKRILKTFLRINCQQAQDSNNRLPIHWTAMQKGDLIENFKLFKEVGGSLTNIEEYGRVKTLGSIAASHGNPNILQEIINQIPTTKPEQHMYLYNKREDMSIHQAALVGENIQCIRMILRLARRSKIRVNHQGMLGVMHYACTHCSLPIVEYLAIEEKFPVVYTKKQSNHQPLFEAVAKNRYDVVQWLFNHGVDPELRDLYGNSALFFCKEKNMLKYLIACGLDLDVKNNNGYTPLTYAFENYNNPIIKCLLKTGKVDPNTPINSTGETGAFLLVRKLSSYLNRFIKDDVLAEIENLLSLICNSGFNFDILTKDGLSIGNELKNINLKVTSRWETNSFGTKLTEEDREKDMQRKKDILLKLQSAGLNLNGFVSSELESTLIEGTYLHHKYIFMERPFNYAVSSSNWESVIFFWSQGYRDHLFNELEKSESITTADELATNSKFTLSAEVLLDQVFNIIRKYVEMQNDNISNEEIKNIIFECYNKLLQCGLLHSNISLWGENLLFHMLPLYGYVSNDNSNAREFIDKMILDLISDPQTFQARATPKIIYKLPPKNEEDLEMKRNEKGDYLVFKNDNMNDIEKLVSKYNKNEEEIETNNENSNNKSEKKMNENYNIFFAICMNKYNTTDVNKLITTFCISNNSKPEDIFKLKDLLEECGNNSDSAIELMVKKCNLDFFDSIYINNKLITLKDCINLGKGNRTPFIHMICENSPERLVSIIKDANNEDLHNLLTCCDDCGATTVHKLCYLIENDPMVYEKFFSDFINLICDIYKDDIEVVKLLNAQDNYGITPTHIVFSFFRNPTYKGRIPSLFYKASIEIQDKFGRTPVHYLFCSLPSSYKINGKFIKELFEKLDEEENKVKIITKLWNNINSLGDSNNNIGRDICSDPTLTVSIIRDSYKDMFKNVLCKRDIFGLTPVFYSVYSRAIFSFTLMTDLVRTIPVSNYIYNGIELYPSDSITEARDFKGLSLLLTAINTRNESLIQSIIMLGGKGTDTKIKKGVSPRFEEPVGWIRKHAIMSSYYEKKIERSALMKTFKHNMSGVSLLLMNGCSPKYILSCAILTGNTGFISYILENTRSDITGPIEGYEERGLHLSHVLFMSNKLVEDKKLEIYQSLRSHGITFSETTTTNNANPLLLAANCGKDELVKALTCYISDHTLEETLNELNKKDKAGISPLIEIILKNKDLRVLAKTKSIDETDITPQGKRLGYNGNPSKMRIAIDTGNKPEYKTPIEENKKSARIELKKYSPHIAHALEMTREYDFVMDLKEFIRNLRLKHKNRKILFDTYLENIRDILVKKYGNSNVPENIMISHNLLDEIELSEFGQQDRKYKTTLFSELIFSENIQLIMQYILYLASDDLSDIGSIINYRSTTGLTPFLSSAKSNSIKLLVLLLVLAKSAGKKINISGKIKTNDGEELFYSHMLSQKADVLPGECYFFLITLGAIEAGQMDGTESAFSLKPDYSDIEYLHKVPGLLEHMNRIGIIKNIPPRITKGPFDDIPIIPSLTAEQKQEISKYAAAFHMRHIDKIREIGGDESINRANDEFYVDENNVYAPYNISSSSSSSISSTETKVEKEDIIPLHVYGVKAVVTVALSGCASLFYDLSVQMSSDNRTKGLMYNVIRYYGTIDGSYADRASTLFNNYKEALDFFSKTFRSKFGAEWSEVSNDLPKFSEEKIKGKYRLMLLKGDIGNSSDNISSIGPLVNLLAKRSADNFFNNICEAFNKIKGYKIPNHKVGLSRNVLNELYTKYGVGTTTKEDFNGAKQVFLAKLCKESLLGSSILRNNGNRNNNYSHGRNSVVFDIKGVDIEKARALLDELEKLIPEYAKIRTELTENALLREECERVLKRLHSVQEKMAILSSRYRILVPPTSIGVSASMINTIDALESERKKLDELEKINELDALIFASLEKGLTEKLNPLECLEDYLCTGIERVKKPKDASRSYSGSGGISEFDAVNKYVGGNATEVWRISAPTEYIPVGPKRYLLHGTCSVNVLGILNMGLKTAPDTVMQTGKRLGFGVYLADNMRKAGAYARTYSSSRSADDRKYVLVVETAYEKAYDLWKAESYHMVSPRMEAVEGYDATLLHGTFSPAPSAYWYDGASVPYIIGEFRPCGKKDLEPNNEWCVYDERRVIVRYIAAIPANNY